MQHVNDVCHKLSIDGMQNDNCGRIFVNLKFNAGISKFKIDTGADVNVINLKTYKNLGLCVANINKTNQKLYSYTKNPIKIIGMCKLKTEINN